MRLRFLPLFIVLLAGSAHAQLNCKKSYGFQANTAGASGAMLCDSSVDGFLDGLKDFNRSNLHYTDTSQANIFGRVNDVNILMDYSAGSNTLNYKFVELGEAGSFTGLTRKESQKMFENYIKKNNIIGRIMEYQAKNSATSPIAGVGGLIPSNIAADFDSAFTNTASAITGPASSGASNNNLVGVGVSYASYSVDNSSDKVKTASIPLSYTIRNGMDPRRQLQFSMPITVIEIGNAKTVHTGLGVAYRLPITDNWTLSPSARYSAVASKDRATVASVYSAALM